MYTFKRRRFKRRNCAHLCAPSTSEHLFYLERL
nr:MAG TPA: hypothetical protein [Caudoviricetes sp.]